MIPTNPHNGCRDTEVKANNKYSRSLLMVQPFFPVVFRLCGISLTEWYSQITGWIFSLWGRTWLLAVAFCVQPPVNAKIIARCKISAFEINRFVKRHLTNPCHSPRAHGQEELCACCRSTWRYFACWYRSLIRVSKLHLYLSWTFCLMSTRFSAEMSRSRYLRCEVLESLILFVGLYLLWELFCCRLQVLLVLLKDGRLVVLFEIVGEDIGVHQCPSALTEDVEGLFQELNLDPRHVVLLHLLHLVLHHRTQLGLKLQGLQVVHVPGQVPCVYDTESKLMPHLLQ